MLKKYLTITFNVKIIYFFRQTNYFGCDKIEDKFCICFIEDVNEADVTTIKHAIRAYRGESSREGSFLLMRDRELLIISEFFARYGTQVRN